MVLLYRYYIADPYDFNGTDIQKSQVDESLIFDSYKY